MKAKQLTIGGAALLAAATGLLVLQPSEASTSALMPVVEPRVAIDVERQFELLALEEARVAAEASRQEVPAVLAAREQARIAAEEARKAEEAQKAEEARLAEEARKAEEARQAQEAQARAQAPAQAPAPPTSTPPRTNDYGIAGSTYTGSYYNAGYESTRKCIVKKESGGNYGIVSSNGLYHGAYQFSRSTGDATARMMGRGDLVGTPVSSWSRYDQDTAFWTLWNHGSGRGHWPTARGC